MDIWCVLVDCDSAMGMESGRIPDSALKAASVVSLDKVKGKVFMFMRANGPTVPGLRLYRLSVGWSDQEYFRFPFEWNAGQTQDYPPPLRLPLPPPPPPKKGEGYPKLVYTTQVNSTFRALWLASSEVISQVLFTSE